MSKQKTNKTPLKGIKDKFGPVRRELDLLPNVGSTITLKSDIENAIQERLHRSQIESEEPIETTPVSARIDSNVAFQLEEYAKILGRSKSHVLRNIITQGVWKLGMRLFNEGLLDSEIEKLEKHGFSANVESIRIIQQNLNEAKESQDEY